MPIDREAFGRAVDALVDEIATARSQPARLLAMLGEAAPLLRIAGRIEEARKTASAAIALAELLEDSRAIYINQIQLAHIMQWEKRFELSTPLFDRLTTQARSVPDLYDLLQHVLHHAGLNLFDQERYAEAARFFRQALEARRQTGSDSLIESSAEALRITHARLEG
ncbi:MAG TPA: tetratricopeptide repeat protein, partial [Usitatibacter sp.]|nr:tetratricopeptide repeat protein [Usitatibacter sp.]